MSGRPCNGKARGCGSAERRAIRGDFCRSAGAHQRHIGPCGEHCVPGLEQIGRRPRTIGHDSRRLAGALESIPQARLLAPVQANGVFVDLPRSAIESLHAAGWHFYAFVGETGVRLMCAWDTPVAAVDRFVADLREALAPSAATKALAP